VQTHRVGVCRGPYPAAFVKAWKAWDKRHKSENDAIGNLPDQQLYAVFAMANCGRDLESYQLQGYEQVRSLLLQVSLYAQALAWLCTPGRDAVHSQNLPDIN
jgi:serine/threonine-protein kinase haspin